MNRWKSLGVTSLVQKAACWCRPADRTTHKMEASSAWSNLQPTALETRQERRVSTHHHPNPQLSQVFKPREPAERDTCGVSRALVDKGPGCHAGWRATRRKRRRRVRWRPPPRGQASPTTGLTREVVVGETLDQISGGVERNERTWEDSG